MGKDRLVIIGAADFQNRLILKAASLGYETHVFAWEDGAVGKRNADYFYPVSIVDREEILGYCRRIRPVGVCSIASDLACITVNYVSEQLGLAGNRMEYVECQTNKYAMRRALMEHGVPCPRFVAVGETFDSAVVNGFRFPIIVKPTDRSGSRSIMKLESMEGLAAAVADACTSSFEHRAIVEEYIDGEEYSMETITYHGEHHFLAATRKYTTGAPHFIETGHKEPSGLSPQVLERAKDAVFRALTALHIENSAGHSEFKIDAQGNVMIIEIGARMGGDCIGSDLVPLSTGNDFMKMVIDVACGRPPEILEDPKNTDAWIRFLFNQQDLDEFERFQRDHPERICRVSDFNLDHVGNIADSSGRIGYYLYT